MADDTQLALPFVREEPDPAPHPDRHKAVAVSRKPPEREAAVEHPARAAGAA